MRRVAMLGVGADAAAAWDLLATVPNVAPSPLSLTDPTITSAGSPDVIWIHASAEPPPLPREPLMPWLEQGGRLLLTQRAVLAVMGLGFESAGPNDVVSGVWRHAADEFWFPEFRDHRGFPHVRGIAAFGPHPLFAGMGQGTYLWAPADGEPFSRATYTLGRRPAAAAVVGCERSYIHLNAGRIVAWEYALGAGGVLCIGAFIRPNAVDPRFATQLRALLANAVVGSAIPHAGRRGPAVHWPPPGRRAIPAAALTLPPTPELDGDLSGLDSDLAMDAEGVENAPVSLASRRCLVVGGGQDGVVEIWMHPYRVLRGLTIAVDGALPRARAVRITPAVVRRRLETPTHAVAETLTTAPEDPVALLEYRCEDARPVAPALALDWTTDLRRTWPYDAGAGGDIQYRATPDQRAVIVTQAGGAVAVFIASRPVTWDLGAVPGRAALRVGLRTALDTPLRLAVLGAAAQSDLARAWRALAQRGVAGLSLGRARHERAVREAGVRVLSPDQGLNTAVEWAKVRLDAFMVDTPGVGRSLAAGYAPSHPGWGDGRPGYAWYFGRDACWSAFAHLAAGEHAAPRSVLQFLGATQDVTGKVIHELTTSGLAHYDAADSTPLYLLLAGRYAAWTGDLEFLTTQWPRLERAYRFCLDTDSDADGLIENTGVGHGWIEMGPLSGAHVTLYLASIWAAALAALAPVARALRGVALAEEMERRARRARSVIADRFRVPDGYALGLLRDGTPQRDATALGAVPLALGVVEPETAARWLDAVSDRPFSAPWGVRLIPTSNPLYDPAGYHSGTVWPLYTGWVSLAEYAAHRSAAGFAHAAANARLPFARQLGAFDEVLRGDVEQGAGVCPDQCWSAAMVVLPLITGMLGVDPDALEGRVSLAPHLPAGWAACEWRGLRVGHTTLDVRVAVDATRTRVRIRRTAGRAVGVTLSLPVPPGCVAGDVRVDDVALRSRTADVLGCRHAVVTFTAADVHEIEMWHGDFAVAP